jgi:2-succinyl-5-enolpyruvyl-6-hydroxy-3-cyclohexene-1-carboxylate synthase
VVLLVGDVGLAHDVGGLLASTRLGLKLTIVLLDNGGGGIFDFLPVSRTGLARAGGSGEVGAEDIYTEHIATPTGLDFSRVAALYGLEHERVTSIPALRAALERALSPRAGSMIVQAQTERADNVSLHGRLWSAVSEACAGPAKGAER